MGGVYMDRNCYGHNRYTLGSRRDSDSRSRSLSDRRLGGESNRRHYSESDRRLGGESNRRHYSLSDRRSY